MVMDDDGNDDGGGDNNDGGYSNNEVESSSGEDGIDSGGECFCMMMVMHVILTEIAIYIFLYVNKDSSL